MQIKHCKCFDQGVILVIFFIPTLTSLSESEKAEGHRDQSHSYNVAIQKLCQDNTGFLNLHRGLIHHPSGFQNDILGNFGIPNRESSCLVTKLCLILCNPMDFSCQAPLSMRFPGKNTGVGYHFLLKGIFLTQGSNLGFLLGRQILYHWAIWENHSRESY